MAPARQQLCARLAARRPQLLQTCMGEWAHACMRPQLAVQQQQPPPGTLHVSSVLHAPLLCCRRRSIGVHACNSLAQPRRAVPHHYLPIIRCPEFQAPERVPQATHIPPDRSMRSDGTVSSDQRSPAGWLPAARGRSMSRHSGAGGRTGRRDACGELRVRRTCPIE